MMGGEHGCGDASSEGKSASGHEIFWPVVVCSTDPEEVNIGFSVETCLYLCVFKMLPASQLRCSFLRWHLREWPSKYRIH